MQGLLKLTAPKIEEIPGCRMKYFLVSLEKTNNFLHVSLGIIFNTLLGGVQCMFQQIASKLFIKYFNFYFQGTSLVIGNQQVKFQRKLNLPILRYRQFKIILLPKILTGSKIRLVGQAGFGFGLSRVIQVFPVEKDCLVTFPIFRNAS